MFFRNWLNGLAARSLSMRSSRRRRPQPAVPVAVEICETRQLLAASSIVLSGGVVTITGNGSVDKVDVIYQSNQQQVKVTHRQGSVTQTQTFAASGVTRLEFVGLGGSDVFTNNTNIACRADGGAGDDQLIGGGANDTLIGGDNNDKLFGKAGDDSLAGGNGNDNLVGEAGHDALEGHGGNDSLMGGDGDDVYYFRGTENLGQDTVKRDRTGNDDPGTNSLYFGELQAAVTVDLSKTTAQTVSSNLKLTLENSGGIEEVIGTNFSDTITGNHLANFISGAEGADTLLGGLGNDKLTGDGGNDSLVGNEGDDALTGGEGDDVLDGGAGTNILDNSIPLVTLPTTPINLSPIRQEGRELVITGTDNPENVGVTIADGMIGVSIDHFTSVETKTFAVGTVDRIRVTLRGGNDAFFNYTALPSLVDAGAGNDYCVGGTGSDTLKGDADADQLFGQQGDDWLYGGDGADIMSGGDGDDFMTGEVGNDGIYGDAGKDTLIGGDGNDLLRGWLGDDSLFGNNGNDDLDGEQDNDQLWGDADNDTLNGGDGSDTLRGYEGNDKLLGGNGTDTLQGGSGDDYLDGVNGNDSVDGEAGVDTYRRSLSGTGLNLTPNPSPTPSPMPIPNDIAIPENVSGAFLNEPRNEGTRDNQWYVKQAQSPTCAFLAALAAYANRTGASDDLIQAIQYDAARDLYGIKIWHGGAWTTQWVNGDWTEGRDPNCKLWVTLYQKAYLQEWGVQSRDADGRLLPGDQWRSPNGTGWKTSGNALDALTPGTSAFTSISAASPATLRSEVRDTDTYGVVASTKNTGTTNGVIHDHAYAINDVFQQDGVWKVRLYNPWGKDGATPASDGADDGLITLTWSQFKSNFTGYYVNS